MLIAVPLLVNMSGHPDCNPGRALCGALTETLFKSIRPLH